MEHSKLPWKFSKDYMTEQEMNKWCEIYQCSCDYVQKEQYKNGCEYEGCKDCGKEAIR